MSYAVKEAFLTLQGEGIQAGSRAVFLRFAGCNLWSGREQDRATAQCNFCDTDFVGTDGPGGGKFPGADALAAHVEQLWLSPASRPNLAASRAMSALVICCNGAWIVKRSPSTPALVALLAKSSNAAMNSGRQSG